MRVNNSQEEQQVHVTLGNVSLASYAWQKMLSCKTGSEMWYDFKKKNIFIIDRTKNKLSNYNNNVKIIVFQ